MGKVLTAEAVRLSRLPNAQEVQGLIDDMRKALTMESSITSALLFGSVLRGDFSYRSDIDCAVVYRKKRERQAMEVMHRLSEHFDNRHRHINWVPCDDEVARTSLHRFDDAFMRHLRIAAKKGGAIKGSLVDQFAPSVSAEVAVRAYVAAKCYSLTEGYAEMATFSEERHMALLTKALEAPMHVARKVLFLKGGLGDDDSKEQVRSSYGQVMPRKLSKMLGGLLWVDGAYTEEVRRLAECWKPESYKDLIVRLDGAIPEVLEFIRGNIRELG